MSERRDIERERDYYRQKFEELGTTLREKQEALEHASSNNRRYQTTAVLTERLAKLTVSPTSKDKLISSFIRTFVETTNIDRAVLFQYQPQQGAFSQLYSLGLKCSQPVSLEAAETPPEFAYADTETPDEGVIAELRRALGVQHLLWAYHSSSKKALLAGNKTEDARFKRPFAAEDRIIIDSSLRLLDTLLRQHESTQTITATAETFTQLGNHCQENIDLIVKRVCELTGATASLYNRLDDRDKSLMLWCGHNLPPDIKRKDAPAGHICYEATICGQDQTVVLDNLEKTEYVKTDQNVEKYGLKAYLGHPVHLRSETIGSLAIVDTKPREFGPKEIGTVQTMARALSLEEERKQALDELREAQQQAVDHERQRALTTMASGIAHDFNNSLMPIQGFTDMILDNPAILEDKEKALDYLRHIHKSAAHAEETVRRMRKFYRPREDTKFSAVDLNEVITEAISLTKPRWKEEAAAAGKEIYIKTELGNPTSVQGNAADLHDVITNLIFNSVDAMPEGGTIRIKTYRLDGDVMLEFSDTGTGMSEETRKRCLEPFYTTKGSKGTGLGLATMGGTIRRHSGELHIDSKKGEGTAFYIALPKAERTHGAEKHEETEVAPQLRILVVEDEEHQVKFFQDLLTANGHTVELAWNGEKGLEAFEKAEYDVVITDRAMPQMNGDELAREIKEKSPQTPVIMLTGFGDMMRAANEKPENVDHLLSKPVNSKKLLEALSKLSSANQGY